MSWIDLPDPTPELNRVLKKHLSEDGRPAAVVEIMTPSPRTLRAVLQANGAVTFGGSVLGRRREELIATTASALNDCFY